MADTGFFLSYSRRQFYFAESLMLKLLEAGVPAWFDADRLVPGVQASWHRRGTGVLHWAHPARFAALATAQSTSGRLPRRFQPA